MGYYNTEHPIIRERIQKQIAQWPKLKSLSKDFQEFTAMEFYFLQLHQGRYEHLASLYGKVKWGNQEMYNLTLYTAWKKAKKHSPDLFQKENPEKPVEGEKLWKQLKAWEKLEKEKSIEERKVENTTWSRDYTDTLTSNKSLQRVLPKLFFLNGSHIFYKIEIGDLSLFMLSSYPLGFIWKGQKYCSTDGGGQSATVFRNRIEPDKTKRIPNKEYIGILLNILSEEPLLDAGDVLSNVL